MTPITHRHFCTPSSGKQPPKSLPADVPAAPATPKVWGWEALVSAHLEWVASGDAVAAAMLRVIEIRLNQAGTDAEDRAATFRLLDCEIRRDRAGRALTEAAAAFALAAVRAVADDGPGGRADRERV